MPVTWTVPERLTDVYLQPQPPPGWGVGVGSGDTGAVGAVVAGGVGVPKGGCALASGDSGAVGSGVAVGNGVAVGWGGAVPRGGCTLGAVGVAELSGPAPVHAVSQTNAETIIAVSTSCHVIPNGAQRSEESLWPTISRNLSFNKNLG